MDIVQCGWNNYKMAENKLIDLLEKELKEKNIIKILKHYA